MKKKLTWTVVAVVLLVAICWYRAETHFENRQVMPIDLDTQVKIDEAGAVQRLAGAITYPTISHDDRSRFDAGAFEALHRYLEASFPRVHTRLELQKIAGYSLLYHLQGSNPNLKPVLFMGHQDVVPVDDITLNEWTHPPFSGTVADERIWGRGTMDDKFSVLGLLEAMEHYLADDPHPQRSIYLAFGHDEEVGGKEGAAAIARHFQDQGIEFEFVLDEGGAVTEGIIDDVAQPVAVVGVSEKGYVNLRLVVNDPGGHSSQPRDHSAVGVLSQAIVKVEENLFPASLDSLYITMDVLGVHLPMKKRLLLANRWLFEKLMIDTMLSDPSDAAGIRTTTAATMISGSSKSNILPTRAEAVVNFRIMPGDSSEEIRAHIVKAIDDERVEVAIEMANEPSPVSDRDSPGYRMIAGTIRALDENIIVAPYMVRGGTDAKYFMPLTPNVYRFYMGRATPKSMHLAHGIDEHIWVKDYLEGVRFFYLMLNQAGRGDF